MGVSQWRVAMAAVLSRRRSRRLRWGALILITALLGACDYGLGSGSGQLSPATGGGDGAATFDGRARSDGHALAAVRQDDGTVVVLISQGATQSLVRYRADGSLDPSFGSGGVARTSIPANPVIKQMIVAPGGDLVVV